MSLEVALQSIIDLTLGVLGVLIWFRLGEPARAVRRSRAQWLELELEVSSVLEKLGTWAAREAKRQSRAAQRDLTERTAAEPESDQLDLSPASPTGTRHPKADIWDRGRAGGRVSAHNANSDRLATRLNGSVESGA